MVAHPTAGPNRALGTPRDLILCESCGFAMTLPNVLLWGRVEYAESAAAHGQLAAPLEDPGQALIVPRNAAQ